jgi:lysophospholipase L1-like esterase
MKTLKIILITLTAFSGCTRKALDININNTSTGNTKTMNVSDSLNYLALGDSYTIGQSVPQLEAYPYQLVNLLNKQSLKVKAPTIIATTGWTTDNLINAIAQSGVTNKKYDFVTLLIGVNDQYQQLSQDNYKIKFAQVLNTAISFAKGDTSRVFVLSIPDWGVTPFAAGQDSIIGPQIDKFNAINRSISQKAGVHYLDITPISRMAAADTSLIAGDGLHPSGKMYMEWMQLLEPIVATEIKK